MNKFDENKHPRDDDGKFIKKGDNSLTPNTDDIPKIDNNKTRFDKSSVMLSSGEYSIVYSNIMTRYANKMPNRGNILIGNYLYGFNAHDYDITITRKIKISGNEKLIGRILKWKK